MATRDGLAQIWYADANGVITGYTPTADNVASAIIDAYNEHYGTVINIWTPETKTLQVGGTVPNWNAYEKIEITTQKIAVKLPGGGKISLMCGTLSNKVFNMLTGGDSGLVATESGIVQNYAGPGVEQSSVIIGILSDYNLEATEVVQTIVNYPLGSEIPQWEQYEQYK